jgi:hypothetical protein
MTTTDFKIIGRKALVGLILYLIPFVILAGGLWFLHFFLK